MKNYLFIVLFLFSCSQKDTYTTRIDFISTKDRIFSDTLRTVDIPSSSRRIIENFESIVNLHYTADYQILDDYPIATDYSFYFLKEFYDILKNLPQDFPNKINMNGNVVFTAKKTNLTNQKWLVSNSGENIFFTIKNNHIINFREKFYHEDTYKSLDGSITDENLKRIDRFVNFIYDTNGNLLGKQYSSVNIIASKSTDLVEYRYYRSKSTPSDYYIWIYKNQIFEPQKMVKILFVRNNRLSRVFHCVKREGDKNLIIKRGSLVEEDEFRRIHSYETEPNLTDTTSYGNYSTLSGVYYFNYNDDNNISKISRIDENNEIIDEVIYKYFKKNSNLFKYTVSKITNNTSQPIRSVEILK